MAARNPFNDPAFKAANSGDAARLTPLPKIKVSKPKTTQPYGANSFNSPVFKKANAPDQRALPKPAPKPATSPGGYQTPSLPGVTSAVNYANQIASGGGSYSPAALAQAYSGMASNPDLIKQAQQIVGYELDPQIKAAQSAYNQENKDYGFLINSLNRQTANAKGDISALFGALDQQLAAGRQQQDKAYADAGTSINSAYDQLAQMLNTGFGNAQSAAQAEQRRLGISGPGQNDRLNADSAYLQGLAQEQKANAVSNIATQGANAGSIAGMLRSSAQEASPHLVAQITMAANEQQQQLLKQHIDNLTKYKGQVDLLNSQRGGKVQMVLKQLQDQLYQRQQDAMQLQFMNSIRAGQLGISAAQLQLSMAKLAQDGQYQTDQLALQAQRLGLEASKSTAPTTGMEKAFSYIASAYPDKSGAKQQSLQDALIDAINGNSTDPNYNPNAPAGAPGYGYPGYDPKYLDVYLRDIDSAVRDRASQGWGTIERNILRNAALKFFGK